MPYRIWETHAGAEAAVARLNEVGQRLGPPLDEVRTRPAAATSDILHALAVASAPSPSYLSAHNTRPTGDDMRQVMRDLAVLARHSWTIASVYMINRLMAGVLIAAGGTQRQREQLLAQIDEGSREFAFALTEPEAGSDAASIATVAIPDGNGFRIEGEKHYITGAASADDVLVVARTGEGRSFGIFIVPRSSSGLTVEIQDKMAMHQHASCRLVLNDVRVTEDAVLGGLEDVGRAWSLLRYTGSFERTAIAAMAAGSASTIVDHCIAFAKARVQFGHPISSFQAVQHILVDMVSAERVMHLLVADAVAAWDSGDDITAVACTAKYLCAENLQDIVAKAMRILGGRAFFDHEQMSRLYREAPFALYAGGTNEIQRNLVARSLGLVSH